MLEAGSKAPDFELKAQSGEIFKLGEKIKEKNIVLYFYPKDETRGCTAQACAFRDQYEVFQEQDAEVVGISSDSELSHEAFAQNHRLPFTLLSDPGGKVRKLYEVPRTLGLIPGRTTFVIDKKGTIQYVFNSQMKPLEHVSKSLEILKSLKD